MTQPPPPAPPNTHTGATGGFQKCFFGKREVAIPIVGTVAAAAARVPTADVFINFASFRSAAASTMEALAEPTIRTVVVIAEGVPEVRERREKWGCVDFF